MTQPPPGALRIATRTSQLAVWQAQHVADLLKTQTTVREVEIVPISTTGDRDGTAPLHRLGTWGVFTREVQNAVLDGKADLAVHSLKDLPTTHVPGLVLGAVPSRGCPFDALVLSKTAEPVAEFRLLTHGAVVGTGSLRRRAQLLHLRPDLQLVTIRGNVDTRLRKLDKGECDALVLAVAGLERLQFADRISARLQPPEVFPAVGQGAIGVECRTEDASTRTLLSCINDQNSFRAASVERALLAELRAGCHAPLGVQCTQECDRIILEAVVLSPDGRERISASETGHPNDVEQLGRVVANQLRRLGADRLITAAHGGEVHDA